MQPPLLQTPKPGIRPHLRSKQPPEELHRQTLNLPQSGVVRCALELEAESEAMFGGKIEVDESYFGGKRKAKRGRGAVGKIPVFGLLKRGGRVYAKIIANASSATLIPIIERKVIPDSIVCSDCWKGDNVLDVSGFKHFRISHSKLFADDENHINGIKNFWRQAKRHMRKFNGVPKAQFGLYLKECEWRFTTMTHQSNYTK